MTRLHGWMPLGVFAVALVISIASAASGPGWGAVLGALTLAGVVRATQALLPRDPLAWLAGVVLLALAPGFRDAAGIAAPSLFAACGAVWAIAALLDHARTPSPRTAALALALVAVVVGAAPWLGLALGVLVGAALARTGAPRRLVVGGGAAIGALAVLWLSTQGLPGLGSDLTAMVRALGPGPAAVLLGAGLLGVAFGAATRLPRAGWLALAIGLAIGHALVIAPAPAIVLALLAVGVAIIPSAVRRAVPTLPVVPVMLAATAPLVGVALLSGADAPATVPTAAPPASPELDAGPAARP